MVGGLLLALSDKAVSVAEGVVGGGPIPREAAADALHIAIAAANGIDYLLTWNCKRLANASLRVRIAALLEDAGSACPVICTPEELMEDMEADPIIAEVGRIGQEYVERFGHDLRALAADLRRREQQHPERLQSFPPKPARGKKTA